MAGLLLRDGAFRRRGSALVVAPCDDCCDVNPGPVPGLYYGVERCVLGAYGICGLLPGGFRRVVALVPVGTRCLDGSVPGAGSSIVIPGTPGLCGRLIGLYYIGGRPPGAPADAGPAPPGVNVVTPDALQCVADCDDPACTRRPIVPIRPCGSAGTGGRGGIYVCGAFVPSGVFDYGPTAGGCSCHGAAIPFEDAPPGARIIELRNGLLVPGFASCCECNTCQHRFVFPCEGGVKDCGCCNAGRFTSTFRSHYRTTVGQGEWEFVQTRNGPIGDFPGPGFQNETYREVDCDGTLRIQRGDGGPTFDSNPCGAFNECPSAGGSSGGPLFSCHGIPLGPCFDVPVPPPSVFRDVTCSGLTLSVNENVHLCTPAGQAVHVGMRTVRWNVGIVFTAEGRCGTCGGDAPPPPEGVGALVVPQRARVRSAVESGCAGCGGVRVATPAEVLALARGALG